ncbi:unnamed protein product, partial [Ectocarpus sp. 4 AP-2014]
HWAHQAEQVHGRRQIVVQGAIYEFWGSQERGEPKHHNAMCASVSGDEAAVRLLGDHHRVQPVRVRRDVWKYWRILGSSTHTVAVMLRRGRSTRSPPQASHLQEVSREGGRTRCERFQGDRACCAHQTLQYKERCFRSRWLRKPRRSARVGSTPRATTTAPPVSHHLAGRAPLLISSPYEGGMFSR